VSAGPIMILAGGTGGHVFPGLAVARVLRERAGSVVWMGTRNGLEARLVPEAGIQMEWISVGGLRGRGPLAWVTAPFRVLLAIIQSLAALHRCRPAAVLGLGGFVSGPGGFAAWLTRRPLLIHEQNAVAGTIHRQSGATVDTGAARSGGEIRQPSRPRPATQGADTRRQPGRPRPQ
jgi:UDP-N-acetylglucosamine--N-acetylmuramyl-(pentapeptide) pyrophosphoryl-undecaprenol N-acetylglucosamine transferase